MTGSTRHRHSKLCFLDRHALLCLVVKHTQYTNTSFWSRRCWTHPVITVDCNLYHITFIATRQALTGSYYHEHQFMAWKVDDAASLLPSAWSLPTTTVRDQPLETNPSPNDCVNPFYFTPLELLWRRKLEKTKPPLVLAITADLSPPFSCTRMNNKKFTRILWYIR